MHKFAALGLLAVSLLSGAQHPGKRAPYVPPQSQYAPIVNREVSISDNKAILHVTFKNQAPNAALKLTIKKLDLNLYEPLTTLPLEKEIPANTSATIDLEYPLAAADKKSSKELELVSRQHQGSPQDPCLNYIYEAKFFTPDNNGSEGLQVPEMTPCVVYFTPEVNENTHLVRSYIENVAMPRTMEVRMLSVTVGEAKELDAPVTLEIAPGAKIEVPMHPVAEGLKKDLQFEYEYRLRPNKTWIKGTGKFPEQR